MSVIIEYMSHVFMLCLLCGVRCSEYTIGNRYSRGRQIEDFIVTFSFSC